MLDKLTKIDKNSIIPYYYQLQEVLENLIDQEIYKPDQKLPSENELRDLLRISRHTAQRALQHLVDRGIAYRVQGKGTYVANKSITYSMIANLSFSAEILGLNKKVRSEVINSEEINAHSLIKKILQTDENAKFYCIQRLRYVDDIPISIQTSYLPSNLVPGLIDKNFEEVSLFTIIKEEYGLEIGEAFETLQAVKATKYEAQLLRIEKDDAVFLLERTTKLKSGETLEFVKTILRGDRGKFFVELNEYNGK
ncbi:GntR family transcriptional regulator [bacterium]|nr:GntR family transcriptional regulator [bacterium]